MANFIATVDAKLNSIQGGTGVLVDIGPLSIGDVLAISTSNSNLWYSGGNTTGTNADGAPVSIINGIEVIDWANVNPVHPSNTPTPPTLPPTYPHAALNTFGIGCLVGSLDLGGTYFAIGTNFTMTFLGSGTYPGVLNALLLYYWDVNSGDNSGTITFDVSVTSPE
jgi:hypothetical protein